MLYKKYKTLWISAIVILLVFFVFILLRAKNQKAQTTLAQTLVAEEKSQILDAIASSTPIGSDATSSVQVASSEVIQITHEATPDPVKSLYMTGWVAGTNNMRDHVINIVDKTEANAVVVDLKDYSGYVSYPVDDPALQKIGSSQRRIPDLKNLTNLLHSKGIYVIGRIACFQDPYFVKLHPEYAMKKATDHSVVWADRNGITWLDPGEQPVWDYLISISKDAYAQGVDEIQFDYTRFPSDGDMKNIYYPMSEGKDRAVVINDFWEYLNKNLTGTGIVTSVDLFGLTATAKDDMGIGQLLENALRNFDYVSPMVYPSHFAPDWNGFKDPQAHPYDVVKISMDTAIARANAINISPKKLRPWLQNFGLFGENYGPKEIRAQIKATYDSGLDSWLLWDASNEFTPQALLPQS